MAKDTKSGSYKKSRHLHQHVAGGGKYAYKIPKFDLSNGRPADAKIQISTGARKLIDVLAAALDAQSEIKKGDGLAYIGKNKSEEAVDYSKHIDGVKLQHVLPVIEITLYNLASSYVGARPSGWDMRQIQGWVHELASKNHKIRYDRKEGGKVIGTVDVYMPIIYAFIKRDEEDSITYLLKLNPIFRDQIANQFVLLPNDYQERLSAAFSGKPTKDGKPTRAKPTKAGIAFCDYLILQLSFKNGGFKETISIEKLGEIMGIQKSRFKKDRIRVNYIIGRAMEVAAKVGLLDGQIVPSYDKSGMAWITYTARKNWHTLPPRIENYKPPKFE